MNSKKQCCLAVDLGSSSGRVMAAFLADNKIALEEMHRFDNPIQEQDGICFWDVDSLFENICTGIRLSAHLNPASISVDTWGVDFVLLDEHRNRIGLPVSYRDHRTDGMMEEFFQAISREKVYQKTGIQFMSLNTLYQLYALRKKHPEQLTQARHLLFSPDYYHYRLSGRMVSEQTIASTSQMVNLETGTWDRELLDVLGLSSDIFGKSVKPGTPLGYLSPELQKQTGAHNLQVIAGAGHDTACAVASVPASPQDSHWAYLSSGSWSLLGLERTSPLATTTARALQITNERGVNNTYRILKNLTGLWLLQRIRQELSESFSFADLVKQAEQVPPWRSCINPDDARFGNPASMIEEIKTSCLERDEPVPHSPGELARTVFESLACNYRRAKEQVEEVSGESLSTFFVVGGGNRNQFLNQLTADICQVRVISGPSEASALGNAIVQFIALGSVESVEAGRDIIAGSFPRSEYQPDPKSDYQMFYQRFRRA